MNIDILLAIIIIIEAFLIIYIGISRYFIYQRLNNKDNENMLIDTKKHELLMKLKRTSGDIPSNDMVYRLSATKDFIELIDKIITISITSYFQTMILRREKYDMKKADKDIKNISKLVKESIKTDVYNNTDLLLTPDYIFDYIISSVTTTLLITAKDYNNMNDEL